MTRSNSEVREPKSPRSCTRSCSVSSPHPFNASPPGSCPTRPRRRSRLRCIRRRRGSRKRPNARCRRRTCVADFIIRIPRVSVAVSEAELTGLLVGAGEHVEAFTLIYVTATEKVEQEIEAGATGTVQWTGQVGTTYDIGTEIGVISS